MPASTWTGGHSSEAAACEDCRSGQYNDQIATPDANGYPGISPTCKACNAGTYAAAGATSCTICSAGTSAAASAASCSPCLAGTYAAGGAGSCSPCLAGTYQDEVGKASCKGASCSVGTYAQAVGQTSPAAACIGCQIGYFQDQTGQQLCKTCNNGQFQNELGKSDCKGSACSLGEYLSTPATTTAAGVCTNCAAGTYGQIDQSNGRASCISCSFGQYQDATGQNACKLMRANPCPLGENPVPGMTSAELAAAGIAEEGATADRSCQPCAAGKFKSSVRCGCGRLRLLLVRFVAAPPVKRSCLYLVVFCAAHTRFLPCSCLTALVLLRAGV